MRILVAGWHGQVALELSELAVKRPDVMAYAVARPALDLCDKPSIGRTIFGIEPDVIINVAAYTDVESAEAEPERAFAHNSGGANSLARQAADLGIPIIQLSTGYVFDGEKQGAYVESDPPAPLNAYGRSKLESERGIAEANSRHVIVRTTWLYSPFGRNFVKSMLLRAGEQNEIALVCDQFGTPTYARHLAGAILEIAGRITVDDADDLWGVYHAAGSGKASWQQLADEVFAVSRRLGGPATAVRPITSEAYPVNAARPTNSCLDSAKLERVFGVRMPDWQTGVEDCVTRLLRA